MITVLAHKSPDTDATGSPIIWAWYLNEIRKTPARAIIQGTTNTEAAWMVSRWDQDMPEIVTGDAADFVEAHVKPCDGVVTTVFHSIAMQYFPDSAKARIQRHLARMGAQATAAAPLAWLRLEQENPGAGEPPTLRLTLWPGGEDRLLARAHPHGQIVSWI